MKATEKFMRDVQDLLEGLTQYQTPEKFGEKFYLIYEGETIEVWQKCGNEQHNKLLGSLKFVPCDYPDAGSLDEVYSL